MYKIPLFLMLAACLTACSSKPSTSDVEKALVADLGNCPRLEIDNVKLVNGATVDENTREVEFTYDLKVLPLPADAIKEHDQAEAAYRAERDQVEAHRKAMDARLAELDRQMGAAAAAETAGEPTPPYAYAKLRLEADALADQKAGLYSQITHKQPGSLSDAWGSGECRGKTGPALAPAGIDVDQGAREGSVLPQHTTWTMRRTDNGWMPAG